MVALCDIDFHGFFNVSFDSHISSIIRFVVDRVAKLVSNVEAENSPASTLRSSAFTLPPSSSCTGEQSS